jgi:uncharacterized protein DUF2752
MGVVNRGLIAIGAAPLAAGALIPPAAVLDGTPLCPFRALTGAPCPLCGATRAFVLFGHADGRWLDYGAVWVLAALALVAVGLAGRSIARAGPAAAGVGVLAWAWALAHAETIT